MSHTTSAGKKLGGGYGDILEGWVCQLSTGVSMQELGEKRLLRELRRRRGLPKLLGETITSLSSLFQSNSMVGRILLPAEISRGLKIRNTRYSKITLWGTHIRWATLCPYAYYLIMSGRIPLETSTPYIVSELKELHDEIVKITWNSLSRSKIIFVRSSPKYEYSILAREEKVIYNIIVEPDIHILIKVGKRKAVNLLLEITLRSKRTITKTWLTSYMIGAYLYNLQPTAIILITPEEVKALVLCDKLLKEFISLFKRRNKKNLERKVEKWLCSNCDLRTICNFET